MHETGTAEYFDVQSTDWSARYQGNRHFQKRRETVRQWLAEAVAGAAEKPLVLDYGCGSGVMMEVALAAGCEVVGVDASQGMLDAARAQLDALGHGASVRLELAQDGFTGTYLERRYDLIICLGVLEYVGEPWQLLEKLASVLKPGGMLILSVPNQGSILRKAETWIHRHPGLFQTLGLFRHLTASDSYLNFQRHQFDTRVLSDRIALWGLGRSRAIHHVAPRWMQPVEGNPGVGMTIIAEFKKPSA